MSKEDGGGLRSLEQYMRSRREGRSASEAALPWGEGGGVVHSSDALGEAESSVSLQQPQELELEYQHMEEEVHPDHEDDKEEMLLSHESEVTTRPAHGIMPYSAWRDTMSTVEEEEELVSSSSLADMAVFAPRRPGLMVDTGEKSVNAAAADEGELEGSSVSVFDTTSDVVTAIFTPRGIDSAAREAAAAAVLQAQQQAAADQIHQLELDVVTLMEEVDALGAARRDAEAKSAMLADENALLSGECAELKLQLRESREKLSRVEQSNNLLISVRVESDRMKEELEVTKSSLSSTVELLGVTERERDGLAARLAIAESQQRQWADASANSSTLARLQRDLADMTDQYREERDRCLRLEEELERAKSKAEVRGREAELARAQYEDQLRALEAREAEAVTALSRARDDLARQQLRLAQAEADSAQSRRQFEDELDRFERDLRRANNEIIDLSNENRRLKSLYSSALASSSVPDHKHRGPDFSPPPTGDYRGFDAGKASRASVASNFASLESTEGANRAIPPSVSRSIGSLGSSRDSYHREEAEVRAPAPPPTTYHPVSHSAQAAPGAASRSSTAPRALSDLVGKKAELSSNGGGVVGVKPPGRSSSMPTSSGATPFATDLSAQSMRHFEALEAELTAVMTEKTSLEEELARLTQRGGRTLKDRLREQQVEARLGSISREVAELRKALAGKPL